MSPLSSFEKGKSRWWEGADGRLASVHSFSADGLPFGRELASAEEEAKNEKKNVSASTMTQLMSALGRLQRRGSRGQG
jgi:hypothetical protein